MNFTVNKISPVLGIKITDVDLSKPISKEIISDIRNAWLDAGGLVVFPGQTLTTAEHISFSRKFGPLYGSKGEIPLQKTVSRYIHPDYPEIYRVSNQIKDGLPRGRAGAGNYWHSDLSFKPTPAAASILNAIEVPKSGGDTLFCNMTAAYEALSEVMKNILAPLRAINDFAHTAKNQFSKNDVVERDFGSTNSSSHPVVRTHLETGKKSLFINPGMTTHLENFCSEESAAILELLFKLAIKPEFCIRHSYKVGDVVMWDNRSVLHYAVNDYADQPRYMERTTNIGEKPI
ncbi:MAG: TauD/TfdA family dioxygenase [Pseudomonadota bacterium]|nr:TauD/TfdA family dioxygenase [Pseudomonadota bacterium]